MSEWEDKNFRLQPLIRKAFEDIGFKKGEQMLAASAALLWYIKATKEQRLAVEHRVREIDAGLAKIGDPITLRDINDVQKRIESVEQQMQQIRDQISGPAGPDDQKKSAGEEVLRGAKQTQNTRRRRKGS